MLFRRPNQQPYLVEVRPSQWDDESMLRSRAMLSGLAWHEPLALEFVTRPGEVRFFIRGLSEDGLEAGVSQFRAAYPQAGVQWLDLTDRPYLDHCRTGPGEVHRGACCRLGRDSAYPLATDPRRGDPFKAVLAAAASVHPGERVVGQLVLAPPPVAWADRLRARTEALRDSRKEGARRETSGSATPVLGLLAVAGIGSQGYRWYEAGETLLLAASGVAVVVGLPLLGVLASKLLGGEEEVAPELVKEKLAFPLYGAGLRVIAYGPGSTPRHRLDSLVNRVVDAYSGFGHAMGNTLIPDRPRGDLSTLATRSSLQRAGVINAAEAGALWHLPDAPSGELAHPGPSAHHVLPARQEVERGCRVGVSRHQSIEVPVHMPAALLYRNQLIVAKTRRGKSTLLVHEAAYLMRRMMREKLLLVVIDPHQDLAEAVLGQVPDGLEEQVTYLNLADQEHPIGLNLLDVVLFPDRDRTAENVVTMMHRLWPDNWGPRMEQALRSSLLCLHQANKGRERDEQFTLLDVLPMLASEDFRRAVRVKAPDPAIWVSWRDNYEKLSRVLQQQIANPVTTKIGRFLVTESTRFVVGQPRSTWNPRPLLRDGGVLVVNSAVGVLGEGPAALIGATVLNLLALMVEEQVSLPPSQRTRVVVLVDESTTLGAADYPRMLSELPKYGASFTLVTQSLSKLDAIDDALRPTIFSNIDGLTVFQVSAQDARYLVPEVGGELDIADLTALDDYECYARWWSDGRRLPPFSLRLDPPRPPAPDRPHAIARRSALRVGRPRDEVAEQIDAILASWEPAKPQKGGDAGSTAKPAESKPDPQPAAAQASTRNGSVAQKQAPPARNENRDRKAST
ncbi:MAG: TraM recognition domain-containing protein [Dehalococcoidia bacterium]|nr:TraM recognition domain-containing protein [Dehalococcoidia bacterium]